MKTSSDACVGGNGVFAPGFRFHPTDQELVVYYLKRKICRKTLKANVIGVTDVYKCDPEELPGRALYKSRDRLWFFFTPRDRKYPNGARSSRGTENGYWKATGKDRTVIYNSRSVGLKKTLVFYRGRAPSGKRTDWVMHEYTLDEEELKRCQNLKEYYALYKIYKKSGPGPKNGEQYGAPFMEEEWADDDVQGASMPADSDLPAYRHKGTTHVDSKRSFIDDYDIGETNQVVDRPGKDINITPQDTGLVCSASEARMFPMENKSFGLNVQELDDETFFDIKQSVLPELQSSERPVEQNTHEALIQLSEDDYLEINDLQTAKPDMHGAEKPSEENWNLDEFDILNDFDFIDPGSFLKETFTPDQETATELNLRSLWNNKDNGLDQSLGMSTTIANYAVDHYLFEQQAGLNQLNSNVELYVSNVDLISDGVQEQDYAPEGGFQSMPIPGLPSEHANPPLPHPQLPQPGIIAQDQQGKEDEFESSEFASSFWGFLDSIPTTPAYASENLIMNRALQKMSVFSRIKFASKNTSTFPGCDVETSGYPSCRSRKGFFVLSVVGALCAVFWVFLRGLGVSGR